MINEGVLMWLLVGRSALVGHSSLVVPEYVRPSLLAFTIQFVITCLALVQRLQFVGGRF